MNFILENLFSLMENSDIFREYLFSRMECCEIFLRVSRRSFLRIFVRIYFHEWSLHELFASTYFREKGQNSQNSRKLILAKVNPLKVIQKQTSRMKRIDFFIEICCHFLIKISTQNFFTVFPEAPFTHFHFHPWDNKKNIQLKMANCI